MAACEAGPCDRMITIWEIFWENIPWSQVFRKTWCGSSKRHFHEKAQGPEEVKFNQFVSKTDLVSGDSGGESTVWSAAANGESTHTKCTKYWRRSNRKMFEGKAERDTPSKQISFSFNKCIRMSKCNVGLNHNWPLHRQVKRDWCDKNILYSPWPAGQTATEG